MSTEHSSQPIESSHRSHHSHHSHSEHSHHSHSGHSHHSHSSERSHHSHHSHSSHSSHGSSSRRSRRSEHNSAPRTSKKQQRSFRILTTAALLTATSVVLAFFAKMLFPTGAIRITFEALPIFFGSFIFGPVVGVMIAVASDFLSCLLSGMAPNLIITLGAAVTAFLSGNLYCYSLPRKMGKWRIVASVFPAHILGSMVLKSVGLYLYYGWAILYRIPVYLGIALIESLLLIYLLNHNGINRQIRKVFHP